MIEAFPEDSVPRYLIRDRDKIYGEDIRRRVKGMGIDEVTIGPYSPWQNPLAERLVGSIRRGCLDHVIVLGEEHLRTILRSYFHYYLRSITHLSLAKDAPSPRAVQPRERGAIIEASQVGGLHHRYERRAAFPSRLGIAERKTQSLARENKQGIGDHSNSFKLPKAFLQPDSKCSNATFS
jgi:hypothetical protein